MRKRARLWRILFSGGLCAAAALPAQESAGVISQQIQALMDQNRQLQQEVAAQQQAIEALRTKLASVGQATAQQGQELQNLQTQAASAPVPEEKPAPPALSQIHLSGEVGLAFFDSGSDGPYNNGEFRVDDAKVFLEAPVWENVYFHSELDLITREAADEDLHFGELFAEAENLPGPWSDGATLNLRVGRMYIPFGEEYQDRGIMEDPLISHSVSDLWGMDEGVEAYGRVGALSYFTAIQDGGIETYRNFHDDKSVAGRLGYEPASWLHLSGSAMRTGELSPGQDELSALWFGNGFFASIGPAATTTQFEAELFELDAAAQWRQGHLKLDGGYIHYGDNNPKADDRRRLSYYAAELVQNLTDRLYGAVRFCGVSAPRGYPLVGQANAGEYFFSGLQTTDLERLSVGLGYQFGPPLVFKLEYSAESGHTVTGESRDREDLFSSELGLKF